MFKFNFEISDPLDSSISSLHNDSIKQIPNSSTSCDQGSASAQPSISEPSAEVVTPHFPDEIQSNITDVESHLRNHSNPLFRLEVEIVSFNSLDEKEQANDSVFTMRRRHLLGDQTSLAAMVQGSDLVKSVYEGGFKLWECSVDLIRFLIAQQRAGPSGFWWGKLGDLRGKHVILFVLQFTSHQFFLWSSGS
jgi:hypothetical protein